jgi:hypothetical protein
MSKSCFPSSTPFADVGSVFRSLTRDWTSYFRLVLRNHSFLGPRRFKIIILLQKSISIAWTRLRFRLSKSNFRIRAEAVGSSTRIIANTFLYSQILGRSNTGPPPHLTQKRLLSVQWHPTSRRRGWTEIPRCRGLKKNIPVVAFKIYKHLQTYKFVTGKHTVKKFVINW